MSPAAASANLLAPTQDPAEVRETADEILERSEYNPSETLGELIQRKIAELFDWLFGGFQGPGGSGGSGGGGILGWLAWLVLVLLLLGVVVFLVRAIASGRLSGSRRRGHRGRDDDGFVVEVGQEQSSASWLGEAEGHEAAGRWRNGIQCRYRALIVELASRGVVDEAAGRTSGELRQEVMAVASSAGAELGAPLGEDFSEATELFEEIWYGGLETGPAERDRFAELAGKVLGFAAGTPADAVASPAQSTEVAV